MSSIRSEEIIRVMIPAGRVEETAEMMGVSKSLVYQWRLPAGNNYGDTGAANPIGRTLQLAEVGELTGLDILINKLLEVRAARLGKRTEPISESRLSHSLASASREFGEAIAALIERKPSKERDRELAEARLALDQAYHDLEALEQQQSEVRH